MVSTEIRKVIWAFSLLFFFVSCSDVDVPSYSHGFIPGKCTGMYVNKVSCINPEEQYYSIHPDGEKLYDKSRYCISIHTWSDSVDVPNKQIEDALSPQFSKIEYACRLVYRTDICKGFKLYSDVEMFGREAGADLSSEFTFLTWFGLDDYIVGENGEFLGRITSFESVSDYAFSNSYLFFKCIVIPKGYVEKEQLTDCTITVELQLGNGKTLSKSVKI